MKQEHWFIFQNDQLLLSREENTSRLFSLSSYPELSSLLARQYIFENESHEAVHCAELPANVTLPANIEKVLLRQAFIILGDRWFYSAVKAVSIINWDRNHQHCGRCGRVTIVNTSSFERVCQHCDLHFYPRISPSIIVRIQRNNEILMARSPHFAPGMYGLIAGFVEIGETLEETVKREVLEEVGIKIKNLHYVGSQPWPFPDSLMVGFTADYAAGDLVINRSELEDAGWYTIDNMPAYFSSSVSISAKLINHFIEQQKRR